MNIYYSTASRKKRYFCKDKPRDFYQNLWYQLPQNSCTFALNTIINNIESTDAWRKFLQWPIVNLLAPNGRLPRVDRKRILHDLLNLQTLETDTRNRTIHRKPDSDDEVVARAVQTWINAGDIRGAVRASTNDCTIVTLDLVSLDDLKAKQS